MVHTDHREAGWHCLELAVRLPVRLNGNGGIPCVWYESSVIEPGMLMVYRFESG